MPRSSNEKNDGPATIKDFSSGREVLDVTKRALHTVTGRALGSLGLHVHTDFAQVHNRFNRVLQATVLHPQSTGQPEGWLSEPSSPPHRHHAFTLNVHPTEGEEAIVRLGVYRGFDVEGFLGSWTVRASDEDLVRGEFGVAFSADDKIVAVTANGQPYGELPEGLFDQLPEGAPKALVLATAIATSLGNVAELDRNRTAASSTPNT